MYGNVLVARTLWQHAVVTMSSVPVQPQHTVKGRAPRLLSVWLVQMIMKEVELSGRFRNCDRIVRLFGACMGANPTSAAAVERTLSQAPNSPTPQAGRIGAVAEEVPTPASTVTAAGTGADALNAGYRDCCIILGIMAWMCRS